jgi:hypothetical protein
VLASKLSKKEKNQVSNSDNDAENFPKLLTSNASNASSHNIVHGLSDDFCSSSGSGTSFETRTTGGKQRRRIPAGGVITVAVRLSEDNGDVAPGNRVGAEAGACTRARAAAPPYMATLTLAGAAAALRATRPGW